MFRRNDKMAQEETQLKYSSGKGGNLLHAKHDNGKGHLSHLGVNLNFANQNGASRPPNTITYTSPTSSPNGHRDQFENREPVSGYTSMDNQREAVISYRDISTNSLARLEKLDPAHPMVAGRGRGTRRPQALDLKHNDNAFHIVASLIVDRFEEQLSNNKSIFVRAGDMYHMERVVPDKKTFIEAVQYRVMNCPEDSMKPIHVVTRRCQVLGLDRNGRNNLLYAPIGSNFEISRSIKTTKAHAAAVQNAKPSSPNELARQQIITELQEASNLMAESVTPETSQFWKSQVTELQTKLRAFDGEEISDAPVSPTEKNTMSYLNAQAGVLSGLWQSIGYAPPTLQTKNEPSNTEVPNNNGIELTTSPVASPSRHSAADKELPIVDVVAPSDLPGGYQFEAELNGKRFIATVPLGGVQKGKTFYCYMEETDDANIIVGRWKDSPTDLFKYGTKHPMVLTSLLCPLLALAQVMDRVGLDITGKKASRDTPQHGIWSPRGLALSMLFVWAGLNVTIITGFEFKLARYLTLSVADFFSLILVNVSLFAFTIYATINTRNYIMQRFQIPVGRFGSHIETLLSAIFFPVSIAQMGRHTASYESQKGACCHPTGIVGYGEP